MGAKLPSWCANRKHSHEPHMDNGSCYPKGKPSHRELIAEWWEVRSPWVTPSHLGEGVRRRSREWATEDLAKRRAKWPSETFLLVHVRRYRVVRA